MAWNGMRRHTGHAHLCLAVLAFSCAELGTNRSASPPQHTLHTLLGVQTNPTRAACLGAPHAHAHAGAWLAHARPAPRSSSTPCRHNAQKTPAGIQLRCAHVHFKRTRPVSGHVNVDGQVHAWGPLQLGLTNAGRGHDR